MSTIPNDGARDELGRYAFHMEPQVEHDGSSWNAAYPGAPWSVTADTRDGALKRLGEEVTRRRNTGTDPLAYADDVFRRHLHHPIPGVYAVDNELYRALAQASPEERRFAVGEGERRRQLGQTYTLADHHAALRAAPAVDLGGTARADRHSGLNGPGTAS